ncbi:MAG: heparinase II/III family protein, partial [Armatimonadetes bacterium]|nr:heparinase II/III family protein [Armatimonadota bacterium]
MDMREGIATRAEALHGFPGQDLPSATPELLTRAEKIAAGTVFFYGRMEVEIGLQNIDWTGSHVGHQEWPAQLNRFYHLPPLAAAYRETSDERFAEAARSYIEDWVRSHPSYETAQRFMPGDSGLNMSIRLGTSHAAGWGGALPAFLASPAFDDSFLQTLADSLSVQAAFLADHLTPWGNWRISELDALVFTALRFPFLEGAPGLLARGIKGMRSALGTQFLSDGVHIERSPGYHEWMARVLASYYELARRFPEADAKVDGDAIVRAFDYAAHDELFGVNDSRAPHRDPDPLRHQRERKDVLAKLLPAKGPPADPPLEQVFPHAGHVFLRSGWEPGADYLAFDAGTWGGGHCHLSRLSFVFRSGGRELVADPGILNYEMSDPLGPYGKSTRAHSTLNLNGWNQCEANADLLRAEF